MIKKISAVLTGLIVVALFWYLVGEVFILKNSKDSISKLQCVSYAPFSKEQSPFLFDNGMVISEDQDKRRSGTALKIYKLHQDLLNSRNGSYTKDSKRKWHEDVYGCMGKQ